MGPTDRLPTARRTHPHRLSATKLAQRDPAQADETANEALQVHRAIGYRAGEAQTLDVLAQALQQLGNPTTYNDALQSAREILAELWT